MTILIFAFAATLLFLGAIDRADLVAAAVLAPLAVAAHWGFRRSSQRRFAFSPAHVAPWARAVANVPMATARITGALYAVIVHNAAPERLLRTDFHHGADDHPVDGARRATALLTASLAPDAFVVTMERGRLVEFHAVVQSPDVDDPAWLV